MDRQETEKELESLLSETVEEAEVRATGSLHILDDKEKLLALYGAGNLGRLVLTKLRSQGIEPVAFADDTAEKQGRLIDNLPVLPPQEVVSRFGKDVVFIVTILNPLLCFQQARERLLRFTNAPIISFLDLAWKYSETFLPYYQFELPQSLLAHADEIRAAFRLFADEDSRQQYVAHLRFRLHLDYAALPKPSPDHYFPSDLLHLPDKIVFVDCGAYDGDTVRSFLKYRDGRSDKIIALEPDATNFSRLQEYVASVESDVAERIHIYNVGVGDLHKKMRFNPTGDMSASLSDRGAAEVEVVSLTEILGHEDDQIYIKLDVEGAEDEALKGAEQLLKRARPVLAISVYHRPHDLWQIPLQLASLNLSYSFFLRTQGADGMDVICYAIPS